MLRDTLRPARRSQGVAERSAREAVDEIVRLESRGVAAAWGTIAMAGGDSPLTALAAAAARTSRIVLGTSIVQTWPQHPLVLAQQALAIESIAPDRVRLGIGSGHRPAMVASYGADWRRPLAQLREYLTVLRTLLRTGEVDFRGEHVVARARIPEPINTPILVSALRPRSFELCGELADGAISWMCPFRYLRGQALPALQRGAERAGRARPRLIAHVPIAVGVAPGRAAGLARERLGFYAGLSNYRAMFELAGYDVTDGYSEALLSDLVVSGSAAEVESRLRQLLESGCDELALLPLLDERDPAASLDAALAVAARVASA